MYQKIWALAKSQVPSLFIRAGPLTCIILSLLVAICIPAVSVVVVLCLLMEVVWFFYFHIKLVPQLTNFKPEDSGRLLQKNDVDRIVNNIIFLIKKDFRAFWIRVSGDQFKGSVSRSTVKSFVRSLLFMFTDHDDYESQEQQTLFLHAVGRIESACGAHLINDESSDDINCKFKYMDCSSNHIRSWIDDIHLAGIIRSTPLIMIAFSEFLRMLTFTAMYFFGWKRTQVDAESGLECWVRYPAAPSSERALICIPGAGFGLMSFLPLIFLLQFQMPHRTILVYRLPWVEVCRPWTKLPQWSCIMDAMIAGLNEIGINDCDVICHSYGTAVGNRFLRELCGSGLQSNHSVRHGSPASGIKINFLGLIDPIVFGGATTGIAGCVINQAGPDMSFAFCGNRAGYSTKEILDFDPREYGQCFGGLGVYVSADDVLVDADLAKYVLETNIGPVFSSQDNDCLKTPDGDCNDRYVHLVVDRAIDSFHGRWLVEIWFAGLITGTPCANFCAQFLYTHLLPEKRIHQGNDDNIEIRRNIEVCLVLLVSGITLFLLMVAIYCVIAPFS